MVHSPYLPDNPWRPVNARYRRALEILENGGRTTRFDDRPTAEVLAFLRQLANCHGAADVAALRKSMPAMAAAFEIRQSASARLRMTLEARLLANEPVGEIATKLAMTPEAIESYRLALFDVDSRRECVDFIVERVIGRPGPGASDDEIEGCVTKTIGYFFGARCLDEILYPAFGKDARSKEPLAAFGQNRLRFKAAMLLQRLDTGDRAARRELIQMIERNVNADPDDSAEATSTIERHIHAMLTEIPWLTGRSARSALPEAIAEADDWAAELRAEELMLLGAGECPEEILSEVKSLNYSKLRAGRQAPASGVPPAEKDKDSDAPSTPPSP